MKKRFLSLTVLLALIISCLPCVAWAATALPSNAVTSYLQLGDYISVYPAEHVNGSKVNYTDFSLSGENGGDMIGEDVHMWKGGSASKWLVRRLESGSFALATSNFEESQSVDDTSDLYFWDIENKSTSVGTNIHVWNDSDLNDISKLFYLVENNDGDPETFYIGSYYTLSKGVTRYLAPAGFSNGTSWATDGCNTVLSATGFPWKIHIISRESSKALPTDVSWMDNIPDCMPLSSINIPGTHDSAATNTGDIAVGDFSIARCQKLFLDEQLLAGIRALDIRLGYKDNAVTLNHSLVTCYHKDHGSNKDKPLTLDYALSTAKSFLTKYPSETVIFVIKKDAGDSTVVDKALTILNNYKSILYDWSKDSPSLGDVRGKIVIMSRLEVSTSSYPSYLGPDLRKWDDNYNDSLHFAQRINTQSGQSTNAASCGVWIQDDYSCSYDNKKLQFLNTAKQLNGKLGTTDSQTPPTISKSDFVFNYNSIATSAYVTTPLVGSRTMNSHLLAEVANQGFWNVGSRMGIVMLDFADKSIAQRIIDSNKKYAPSAHNYTTAVTAPTCTAQGYTTYTCTICGNVTKSDYTEMVDHEYGSIVTPPTETEQGYTTYTCNLCGYSYTGDYTEVLIPRTIYFIVPEGVEKIAPITGTSFTMPSVTGFPVTAAEDAVFIGWVPKRYDNSSAAPTTIYYEGKTYYSGDSDVILYPLYLYGVTGITRTFTQFDGTNTLYIGDTILITAADYDYAISTTQNATNREGVAITKSEDKKTIVITDEDVALFTLGFGVNGEAEPSIISFKDSHGYLYAASSTSNNLCSTQTLSADASWTLSRNSSTSSMNFVAQGSNSRKYMRFNSTYNRFACYASAEQADIHMYVQTAATLDNACYTTEFACLHSTTTTIRTEPSCESDGFISNVCDHCGEELSRQTLPLIGHSYESYVTIPTCTTDGCTTYVCTNCSHTYTADKVSALGHQYEATVTEVTCTQNGYTYYLCTVCGHDYTDDIVNAAGHVYVAETIAPTCEESGYTSHTCSICGDHYTDLITEALGHSYQTQVKEPSCTEDGYTLHICSTCNNRYTENEIAAFGHDYMAVDTPPTCTLAGYTTYTCTTCNYSYVSNDVPAIGHIYNDIVVSPTCISSGYTQHNCMNCEISYRTDETDPIGHSFDEGVVTTEKTCETDGAITYSCLSCSESYTESIPSGHELISEQIQEVSCTQNGIIIQRCTVCEKVLSTETTAAYDHDYIAVITPPNCKEDGYSTFTCLICNDTYISSHTPAYGHDYIAQCIPSTCSEMGYTLYSCLECNDSYQADYTPKTEHTLQYIDDGQMHKHGCVDCDYYVLEEHIWNDGDVISVGTCTSGTVTSYHCTICNAEKLETTANGSHAPVHMPRLEPTCTADGYIEHYRCSYCNGFYTASDCVYVLPASYIVLSATGHTYAYTDNGKNHTISCANCDYSAIEEHAYIDDACICGAIEVTEPEYLLNENLKFTMSISAGTEMTVSYNIMGAAVNSYKDFYLEVTKEVANGDPITTVYGITADREAMTAKVNPATGEALMYQVTYEGINAKEMGDNFSTTLYAVGEDGTIYYGNTVVDSIKSFLVSKLDAAASSAELKTMAIDMLKYGAAAQVRLGYNTANLVTADLTEEQLAYATQDIPEAVDYATATGDGVNVNTNITVTSRVQLNLSCIYTSATDPNAIKCVITDAEGNVLAELATTNKNNVMFSAIYENVGAKEMRDVINATFYEGETVISKTISWSVESYVAQVRAKTNAAEDEINMVNAMLTYGDAVAAYMSASVR